MKERYEHILGEVVTAYLASGQPVGSRTLSEGGKVGLSPASIRNVMADLEKMGMLASPHTSAGRIPTDTGLRYFIDSLMVVDRDIQAQLDRAASERMAPAADRKAVLRRATDELANLTRFAGLVSVRESGFSRITRLELVPVSSEQLLAVIVSDEGRVQNRIMPRMHGVSEARLPEISRQLTRMLHNCDIDEARERLRREMSSEQLQIRELLEGLMHWTEQPVESQADLFISGQRQLLEMPEFSVIDKVRSLLTAFEEKENLLRLVEQVESSSRGVKVFIGAEHALVDMEETSVVLSRYQGEGNVVGTLGVIGPKRMRYDQVLPVVDCTAKWVSRVLGGER